MKGYEVQSRRIVTTDVIRLASHDVIEETRRMLVAGVSDEVRKHLDDFGSEVEIVLSVRTASRGAQLNREDAQRWREFVQWFDQNEPINGDVGVRMIRGKILELKNARDDE